MSILFARNIVMHSQSSHVILATNHNFPYHYPLSDTHIYRKTLIDGEHAILVLLNTLECTALKEQYVFLFYW
jgi:hypothetical protein